MSLASPASGVGAVDGGSQYQGLLISSDSHVMESANLWVERLPAGRREQAPRFLKTEAVHGRAGGSDPQARLKEMAVDGVSAEILYPTLGLQLYALQDSALQQACFQVYNDWVAEYCSVAPDRMVGVAMLTAFEIENAVKELERTRRLGLRGVMIWQAPPEELPFYSSHYDRLWAAAQDADVPVSLHILTGFDWSRWVREETVTGRKWTDEEKTKIGQYGVRFVNAKVFTAMNALHDLIFSGVFKRFPKLKLVLVENNLGWLPFMISQWDFQVKRAKQTAAAELGELPSNFFRENCYATFIQDPVGGRQLSWFGADNCMWSNDYPHHQSSWPDSRKVIKNDLGHLDPKTLEKVTWRTASDLYGLRGQALAGNA